MIAHKIAEEMELKHESIGVGSNEHFEQRVTPGPNRRIVRQNLITANASNTHVFLVSQFKSFENGLCVCFVKLYKIPVQNS